MTERLESIPKPLIIGAVVLLVALAIFIAVRNGNGSNSSYGTMAQIMDAEKRGKQTNGGYNHTDRKPGQQPQ
ncbi:MAG TPA: hypothetical protein VGS41_18535 [Chthonomonadales bacterium]|nr:hypothetical protein [Chthonomonadales bacterium]